MKYAIYSICKNEIRLSEWIDYYIKIGFDFFVIYDDYSDINIRNYFIEKKLKNYEIIYPKKNKFEYDDYKTHSGDEIILEYNFMANNVIPIFKKHNIDYVLWIDGDEFLVLNGFNTLNQLINYYEPFDLLKISWVLFGNNNMKYNNTKSIIFNFTECNNTLNEYTKCFFKIDSALGGSGFSHYMLMKPKSIIKNISSNYDNNHYTHCRELINSNYEDANIYIAHYIMQDLETYIEKRILRYDYYYNLYFGKDKSLLNYCNIHKKDLIDYYYKLIIEKSCIEEIENKHPLFKENKETFLKLYNVWNIGNNKNYILINFIINRININWVPNKSIDTEKVNNLLNESIKSKQFTNYGPNVKLLENFIKKEYKVTDNKSVILVSNGAVAIQCLAKGIEIYENKKINYATQAFTFPSSCQGTLSNTKIVDIDEEGGINLNEIDETIDGIIVTNIFGNIVNIDKYIEFCNKNNKYLIFDNAATSYTFYKGINCINYGIGSIISFHHTKPFGFGEGGAIIVDSKYENIIRKIINFGINLDDINYFTRDGNNYKMSDISAVYILQYLHNNFNYIVDKHIKLYNYFKHRINNYNNMKLFPSFHDDNNNVLSCFCILFDDYDDNLRLKLLEKNIYSRKYYVPLKDCIITTEIYNKILCIPCTIDMEYLDIDTIFFIIDNYKKM